MQTGSRRTSFSNKTKFQNKLRVLAVVEPGRKCLTMFNWLVKLGELGGCLLPFKNHPLCWDLIGQNRHF